MTTLQTFQNEIDEINHRELAAKKRAHPPPAAADARAPKAKKGDAKVQDKKDVKPQEKGAKHERRDSTVQDKADAADSAEPDDIKDDPGPSIPEVEQAIKDKLLPGAAHDPEEAKNLLAMLLTRRKGELIFRIGARPPRTQLFQNAPLDDAEGWAGPAQTEEQVEVLVGALTQTVEDIGGKACVLVRLSGKHPRASVLLRIPPPNVSLTPEVRCAIVGNVDSGKSTTLGVLTRGGLDDGRGLARVVLFRHKHEIETGRTSSVGMEILGFDTAGHPVLPNSSGTVDPDVLRREKLGWDEISIRSAKIVTFIDLAGHEKYLKTTLYGLTSGAPSCVILMVGANAGVIGMSKEHLAISLALSVPVVVCVTKVDMTPPNVLAETLKQVEKILRSPGCRKVPVLVKSVETAVEVSQVFAKEKICPIFQISNVTGAGLDFVRTFLNLLPSSEDDDEKYDASQPLEFSITDVWSVPYVGTVVNGILNSGTIKTGDAILVGPDEHGQYLPTSVKSMQRKRADVTTAEAGQTVALALKRMRRAAVRKGMVVVHNDKLEVPPKAVRKFEGSVLILYHNTTLQPNYQAMLHCGAVRQTVRIITIDHPQNLLRTGDRATVTFEFIAHPEFVKVGMKLLFREGKTKGLGVITKLL
ncbi:P-loop containing nucleoside triphosphate hydrolase protein [Auriscalpium vulgare]|uniref:P-loop containing nucleoside triphosphate hydrolase protein n=1 Tax=Auriscalpium vulgare TaxID=40419 RepID=A0ACB8RZX3_9AGAM|nr:P-loop containing nucleoside triphosphate hydrolase protein [Auriscalpium vulgare]